MPQCNVSIYAFREDFITTKQIVSTYQHWFYFWSSKFSNNVLFVFDFFQFLFQDMIHKNPFHNKAKYNYDDESFYYE